MVPARAGRRKRDEQLFLREYRVSILQDEKCHGDCAGQGATAVK